MHLIYLKSDHHQILRRKVETRLCISSSRQNIGQYSGHLTAGCSYQHTLQNSKEYFEKWIKIFKNKKNKMAEIQDGRYNSGLYNKMCPPYVWMPSVHIQHKESMLCQTKGVSICPHTFGYLHMFEWPPCMLGCPHMFGCPCMFGCCHMFGWPPVCLDVPICLPVCLDIPICLNAPVCLGCPYVWMPLVCLDTPICLDAPICLDDVWMPPVHTQHKERMLCQTKGVSIYPIHLDAPIFLDAPCMFGCHHMFGCTPCMFGCPMFGCPPVTMDAHMFGHPLYVCLTAHLYVWTLSIFALPHMFGCPLYVWVPPMFGHPTVWLDAPHVWTPTVCLDALHMFGSPCMFGCCQMYGGI